jgi:hypothetical protein
MLRMASSRLIVSSDGISLPGGKRGASFDPVVIEMTGLGCGFLVMAIRIPA